MGDVEVGRLRSGEDTIDLPVGIRGETLPSHVGVFATTGMGKSNLMKVLAGQLLAARAATPCCCSTPTASTWRAGRPAGAAWPTTLGHAAACGSTRPAPGRPGQPAAAVAGRADRRRPAHRLEVLRPQSEALESAYALLGDKGMWLTRLAEEDPEVLKDAELGRHALATIQVLSRRAKRIVRLPLMTDDPSQSLTGKVLDDLAAGKVVLVDTSGLEAVEETLVASLTRSLLDERASAYRTDRERFGQLPRTLVALEEAQRVLTRLDDAEFNVFPRLAREGRKFNVGLCAVTQQPKLIDPELLSQFNTYFVLGLADERDRNTLRSSSKQDLSDLGAEIQTLMPGEALVTNPEAPFALPARVHLYEDWLAPAPSPRRGRPAEAMSGSTSEPAGRHRRRPPGAGPLPGRRPNGLNQREVDFAASWHRAVEAALGLDPDAVLVLGDLFDAPGPPTGRSGKGPGAAPLAEAGVPTLAISGNHDTRGCASPARPTPSWPTPSPACASSTGAATSRSTCWPAAGPRRAPVHRRPRPQGPDRRRRRRPLRRPPEPARHPRRRDRPGPPLHLRRRQRARGRPVHPGRRVRPHPARPLPQLRQGRPQRLVPRLDRHLQLQGPARTTSPSQGAAQPGHDLGHGPPPPRPGGRPLRSYRLDAFDLSAPEVYEAAAGLAAPSETEGAVVRLFVNRAGPSCAACSTAASSPPTPSPAPWSSPSRSRPTRTSRPPSWPPSP